MLIQSLQRLSSDSSWLPHLKDALICLDEHKDTPAPARFDFPGGYLLLQEGITTGVDEGDYEAHRCYLDVQVLLEGTETMVWSDISNLQLSDPYDPEKDKAMYVGEGCAVTLQSGTCYVCWPEDGHKACRNTGQPTYYRKAVIKLLL
ncbi:YhcH/YjgK/YiaL family protein [Lacrimispora sp. 38-1]|uniref:YhcH/YjgK/YiaL family protein n=1 Tax=Lacrimispora sp. 38-1 TaxID=3125778 RepID=UPI003CF8F599